MKSAPGEGRDGPRVTPLRVMVALALIAAALVLTMFIRPWIPHTQFVFFYGAVMGSAVLGGLALATGALLGSVLAAELLLFGDVGAIEVSSAMLFRNLALAVVSLTVAVLIQRQRRAGQEAERRTRQAEDLAAQLTEQATELELQVTESEALAAELEETNRQMQEQADAAYRAGVRSEKLQRLTGLLLETVGEAGVARVIAHDGRTAVEAGAAIVAMARDHGRIEVVAAEGADAAALNTTGGAEGRALLTAVLETGEAVWLDDKSAALDRYPEVAVLAPACNAWCALPLRADRRELGVMLFGFSEAGDFAPEDRSFLLLLAQQCAQALERARLHETSLRARVRAEFAERRLALLAEASARLSASLDYEATLASLAELAVPDLADWCLVHLDDEHVGPRLLAVVHSDAERATVRRQLEAKRSGAGLALTGFQHVVEQRTALIEPITDDLLRATAVDDEHLDALRSLQLRSQLTVPIQVEHAAFGTIVLSSAESGRTFGEADVRLALELGRRAGQAVENARLYQAAHFASEAKSNFLAVMSHELRTPLNAIIGYSDLLLLGVPSEIPDRARRQIERVRSASNSLLHLVEEVLSFSRIEAGKEEIRISPVDLSALLADAVAMIEPLAAEKHLAVELRLPDQRLKIVSDERKIGQIMTNLLSNAVKFTEHGGICVQAVVEEAVVRLSVHDTGIGIPDEHLERIFDPFWQVEQSSTRRFGGTGLGLGVARKLAKLLEGRLEVESEVGKGSVFTLTLPRHTPGMSRST